LRNAANDGCHPNVQFLANLSHALTSDVTGYVELWGQANEDPTNRTLQSSLDLSMSWIVWQKLPNLQFDIGANIGLTPATPRIHVLLECRRGSRRVLKKNPNGFQPIL